MQSLLANMALGLRRLEEQEEAAAETGGGALPAQERARKATLKIACAANRCSWISCCEMADFIRTGGDAWKTHRPVQIFLGRPMYMLRECKRLLQQPAHQLIEAPDVREEAYRPVDVIAVDETSMQSPREAAHGHDEDEQEADGELDSHTSAEESHEEESAEEDEEEKESFRAPVAQPAPEDTHGEEEPRAEQPRTEETQDIRECHRAAQPWTEESRDTRECQRVEQPWTEEARDTRECLHAEQPRAEETQQDEEQEDPWPSLSTRALSQTTSAYDDWLHRGPFLHELDFYTYVRYVHR